MKPFMLLLVYLLSFPLSANTQSEFWFCSFYSNVSRIGSLELTFPDNESGVAILKAMRPTEESARGHAVKLGDGFQMNLISNQTRTRKSYECAYVGPNPYSTLFTCDKGGSASCRRLR